MRRATPYSHFYGKLSSCSKPFGVNKYRSLKPETPEGKPRTKINHKGREAILKRIIYTENEKLLRNINYRRRDATKKEKLLVRRRY